MTNQPKKPKKPSPRKFTRKMAGCCRWEWKIFRDKYYPGEKSIPITPENFYLFCMENKGHLPAHIADAIIKKVGKAWSKNCRGIEEDFFWESRNQRFENDIFACIFALQVQGVFR